MFTKCVNEVTRLTLFFTSKFAPASRRTLVIKKLLLLKAFKSAVSPYCIVEGGEGERFSRAKKSALRKRKPKLQFSQRVSHFGITITIIKVFKEDVYIFAAISSDVYAYTGYQTHFIFDAHVSTCFDNNFYDSGVVSN